MKLLILGLILRYLCLGLISAVLHFTDDIQASLFDNWNDGSYAGATFQQLTVLISLVVVGLLVAAAAALAKVMNGLLLGENYARTLGIAVAKIRVIAFAITAVLLGAVTAYSGPVAFLGLVMAQLARGIFRTSDHRILIPGSVLLGAAVALVTDLITHITWSKPFLHLNAVNGLIGAPVVIWLILRHRSSRLVETQSVTRIVLLAFLLAITACKQIESPPARTRITEHLALAPLRNLTHACPDTYNARWDYFPNKSVFNYSSQLRVNYFANYKVVDFNSNIPPKSPCATSCTSAERRG